MFFFVSLHPHILLNRRPFVNAKVKVRQDVFYCYEQWAMGFEPWE